MFLGGGCASLGLSEDLFWDLWFHNFELFITPLARQRWALSGLITMAKKDSNWTLHARAGMAFFMSAGHHWTLQVTNNLVCTVYPVTLLAGCYTGLGQWSPCRGVKPSPCRVHAINGEDWAYWTSTCLWILLVQSPRQGFPVYGMFVENVSVGWHILVVVWKWRCPAQQCHHAQAQLSRTVQVHFAASWPCATWGPCASHQASICLAPFCLQDLHSSKCHFHITRYNKHWDAITRDNYLIDVSGLV